MLQLKDLAEHGDVVAEPAAQRLGDPGTAARAEHVEPVGGPAVGAREARIPHQAGTPGAALHV